jgi:hypothetical protein
MDSSWVQTPEHQNLLLFQSLRILWGQVLGLQSHRMLVLVHQNLPWQVQHQSLPRQAQNQNLH